VAIVMGGLIVLQLAGLTSLGLLMRSPDVTSRAGRALRVLPVVAFAAFSVGFDTLHFML